MLKDTGIPFGYIVILLSFNGNIEFLIFSNLNVAENTFCKALNIVLVLYSRILISSIFTA